MKKSLFLWIALIVIIAGCSTPSTKETGATTTPSASPETNVTESPSASTSPSPEVKETEKPEQSKDNNAKGKSKLSKNEELALEYVNVFLNGEDKEAKDKFVKDHVVPEIQPVFEMAAALGGGPADQGDSTYVNPLVMESVNYDTDGEKAEVILIQADEGKELMIMIIEGKLAMAFNNENSGSEMMEGYADIRAKFKTPAKAEK
ncbi:hypothetical protein [Paenibacillus eucommiae]|uniref:Lipoprotein n=1 Tax=Paenibacillus eucommiae TaxID=1355755 RepID=A0ABS4J2L1_9BACL|nr:hypothetical protein [Paenibacillus eucommiae]MBP1994053.1 hypothetical protein [Paenibacillus eucommiae]